MMDDGIPKLPQPTGIIWAGQSPLDVWSESDIRGYVKAVVGAERERCARICESVVEELKELQKFSESGAKDLAIFVLGVSAKMIRDGILES